MTSRAEAAAPFTADDHRHMARALRLARRGLWGTHPNPRVGCVVVRDGDVVGEGWHERAGAPHAEIHALRAAGERARGAVVYVTLEPCSHHGRTPPCADALVAAGVAEVVAAVVDPNPQVAGCGLERLRAAGIAVRHGLMAAEAEALNAGFFRRQRAGLPWVRVKSAMSLDGRTAMASGESKWITGEAARLDVHRLRASASHMVTGIGTVLADDPSLTVRLPPEEGAWRQPERVILDPRLETPAGARILREPGETFVATLPGRAAARPDLAEAGARLVELPGDEERIDLAALLEWLARERQANEVMVEAGATLAGAFLEAGLADELVLYLAPHLMGSDARGAFTMPGVLEMVHRRALEIRDVRPVGHDWRIVARPLSRHGADPGQ